jgi:hypothetical protein
MILLLLIGMLAAEDSVKTDADMDEAGKLVPEELQSKSERKSRR